MKKHERHYSVEINDKTASYFETIRTQYGLTDDQLLNHALNSAERELAEFNARIEAQCGDDF